MTPEDRARKVCDLLPLGEEADLTSALVKLIADHFRAAVAEEREACAKVAEAGDWEAVIGEDYYQTVDIRGTAANIAQAIRSRKGQS